MVSSISGNSQILTSYSIENRTSDVATTKNVATPATVKTEDTLEITAGHSQTFTGNAGLEVPAGVKMSAAVAGTVTEYDVAVMTGPASQVDELTAELKLTFKDDAAATQALDGLLNNKNFIRLDDAAQEAVLSQCKNFPNANSVNKLGQLVGASWFKKQDLSDMQRSAKAIAYMAETAQSNPGSLQNSILENTMGRLFSGEIPLTFTEMDDEPGYITFGYAIDGQKGIYINRALVPDGNGEFPKDDNYAQEAVLATIAHETSHQVNKDKNKANYKYFQAEYRAWYVGYVARFGVEPTRQQAFDRSVELIGIYSNINTAFYGDNGFEDLLDKLNKFFTGDPLESRKILDYLNQFVEGDKINEKDQLAKADFLTRQVVDPYEAAPLPDSKFNPDMDN